MIILLRIYEKFRNPITNALEKPEEIRSFAKSMFLGSNSFCRNHFNSEENIWHLVKKVAENVKEELENCLVVFITNEHNQIKLWNRKVQPGQASCVLLDYHVILLHKKEEYFVYDFDVSLPFPVTFSKYLKASFQGYCTMDDFHHSRFRVVKAKKFLHHFASDRRHMISPSRTWIKTPPNYPPITTSKAVYNLNEYTDVKDPRHGPVYSLSRMALYYENI